MKHHAMRVLIAMLLSSASLYDQVASAETTNCTAITSLPAVITTQGVYCFTGNLTTSASSGYTIDIQANNVTIDMNGFKLGGQAAGPSTIATGIYAYHRNNITIRNGTIRGFYRGIWLRDGAPYETSKGHLVEDVLADANTYAGIVVEGSGTRILNNQVVETGGATVGSGYAYGILAYGSSATVINNQVTSATASGSGQGQAIVLNTSHGGVVADNRVTEVSSAGGGSFGIVIFFSDYVVVRDNAISTADYGIYYTGSSGKYMGNLTHNIATTAFIGGNPVGTND